MNKLRRSSRESKGSRSLLTYQNIQETSTVLRKIRRKSAETKKKIKVGKTKQTRKHFESKAVTPIPALFQHRLLTKNKRNVVQGLGKYKAKVSDVDEQTSEKRRKKRTRPTGSSVENVLSWMKLQNVKRKESNGGSEYEKEPKDSTSSSSPGTISHTRLDISTLDMKMEGGKRRRTLHFQSLKDATLTLQALANVPQHVRPLSVCLSCPSICTENERRKLDNSL